MDVQLNNALRVISGSLKSTPLPWLPVLANIEPASLRREAACRKEFGKCHLYQNSLLFDIIQELPPPRLISRKPPWLYDTQDTYNTFDINQKWRDIWNASAVSNKHIISDPCTQVPGFELDRKEWTLLNRLRTYHGRCAYNMYMWGLKPSPNCDCGDLQTMEHILTECPIFKFNGNISDLHAVTPDAMNYLKSSGLNL